jgi:hypothetical protein
MVRLPARRVSVSDSRDVLVRDPKPNDDTDGLMARDLMVGRRQRTVPAE